MWSLLDILENYNKSNVNITCYPSRTIQSPLGVLSENFSQTETLFYILKLKIFEIEFLIYARPENLVFFY